LCKYLTRSPTSGDFYVGILSPSPIIGTWRTGRGVIFVIGDPCCGVLGTRVVD